MRVLSRSLTHSVSTPVTSGAARARDRHIPRIGSGGEERVHLAAAASSVRRPRYLLVMAIAPWEWLVP